jgi:hypothetical protein
MSLRTHRGRAGGSVIKGLEGMRSRQGLKETSRRAVQMELCEEAHVRSSTPVQETTPKHQNMRVGAWPKW